ncbi:3-hydroxyacyl-ACP dehydratase FabZ family protein [Plantactinospora endophytica]|uniref:3-hydroxyacyl-[acyl-carrier-protein] dehydratase FabZ n=1 Tax=Plantactinospora endophytica TaxID=673535 RepID=A0ABQ4EBU7_9ACTN|nr:beta-hydroxyacyl-ACP dehydratase [Plantactinospora endophytica]GIG91756.1 3-hydroxyacyl-[acyl-carrier-protein] dehydratase FabZ [Plantactinospora endophytica]
MFGVAQIRKVVPHRYPILLLDRVVELVPGERLTALKAVSCTESCYEGLGNDSADRDYAYPATLIVESWAQAGVLLATWDKPNPDVLVGAVGLAGAINNVSFGGPVYPGEVLEHRVRLTKVLGDTVILEGETVVGDRTVMRVGQFVETQRPVSALRPAEPAPVAG